MDCSIGEEDRNMKWVVRTILLIVCAGIWAFGATYLGVPPWLVGMGAVGISWCFIAWKPEA